MNTAPDNMDRRKQSQGFTLPEVMMSVFIFGAVMAGSLSVYTIAQMEWKDTNVTMTADHDASMAMERMVHGPGLNLGLRAAEAATANVTTSASGWWVVYYTPNGVTNTLFYDKSAQEIQYSNPSMSGGHVTIGKNVSSSSVVKMNGGLQVNVVVHHQQGKFSADGVMSTFVRMRN